MDHGKEYHDPDYPGTSQEGTKDLSTLNEEEKLQKIRNIVRREFNNELEVRENEVMQIDQRLSSSRRLLHRLRCNLVDGYYNSMKLQLSAAQAQDEVAAQTEPRASAQVRSLLNDGQRRLHPSVRKLLGKKTVDLDEILLRSRPPRNNTRKDYSAMVRSRNYTIAADNTKSLRSEPETEDMVPPKLPEEKAAPRKVPRHLEPRITNVVTLDEATRNQLKYRYRIIIGNTSKYAPAASALDRSTHKWLLYLRGPRCAPDLSPIVTSITVTLHHSYAPHHLVHLHKPPFHISRRGWGEFPAKVELHFTLPERNRPAVVEHTIKLDRNYTGLQTLGAETVVDVWLYSTPDMLKYEFREDMDIDQTGEQTDSVSYKQTNIQKDVADVIPKENEQDESQNLTTAETVKEHNDNDSWLEFFSKPTELDVDEMIIKPEKKNIETIEISNGLEPTEIENNDLNIHFNSTSTEFSLENALSNTRIDSNDLASQKCNETSTTNVINNYRTLELQEDLPNELLSQPTSLKKRIMKYMDPTTGKIYYLEMDRKLDLSKVQEIVINSKGNIKTAKISPIKANGLKSVRKNCKKGVSLLKPEVKNQLKVETSFIKDVIKKETSYSDVKRNYTHIENDHCYLATPWCSNTSTNENIEPSILNTSEVVVKKEKSVLHSLCACINRFTSVRMCVNYLLNNIPIISSQARDPDYVKNFPFTVETENKYWKLDFAKRRNIEWSRAKLINKLLAEHFNTLYEPIWRTKQILIYSRLHGYYPVRPEPAKTQNDYIENQDWSSWLDMESSRKIDSSIKDVYHNDPDLSSLKQFDSSQFTNLSDTLEMSDSDEEIEVVNDLPVKVKKEVAEISESLTVLPVESEEDRLRFLFIEKKSADIGIELRNEDVGSGYTYSAVHAVILSAVKSLASELIRGGLAEKLSRDRGTHMPTVWMGWSSSATSVPLSCIQSAARSGRLGPLLAHTPATQAHPPITKPL